MVCLLNSSKSQFKVQKAIEDDLFLLHSLDIEASVNEEKNVELQKAYDKGFLYLAYRNEKVVGYAVFDYQFNSQGYIRYIYVHPIHRGKGLGLKMLKYFESICESDKIYVGAKPSNRDLQNLLFLQDFIKVGVIFNCEEVEPLNLFCKTIDETSHSSTSK